MREAVGAMLRTPVIAPFSQLAQVVAERLDADAVLFYGSSFRTGDLEGVADFYALSDGPRSRRGAWSWPVVSYHEVEIGGTVLRAKVAAMSFTDFERAARGQTSDTTIWARFAQPSRLVHARDDAVAQRVEVAVGEAIRTAARLAAALGPERGPASAFWLALFRETYGAEFRIERNSRARTILDSDPRHYETMLPLAWREDGLLPGGPCGSEAQDLQPHMTALARARELRGWRRRKSLGKPLNVARLLRAVFTFDGAARYALWKIERHSGVHIPLTPWRERHPILAAPGVLFRLWRARRA